MTSSERSFYRRKLYALLQLPSSQTSEFFAQINDLRESLACFNDHLDDLNTWWNRETTGGQLAQAIGASSDRVNLHAANTDPTSIPIRHPISGEPGNVNPLPPPLKDEDIPDEVLAADDPKKVFWWFWRFYPELWLNSQSNQSATLQDGLLYPAHTVLPDCPIHSHQATVSALVGAMYPASWHETDSQKPETPYLLLFSFSPVQEFIKASRKFLDFWAGSYLLHYLSARLCWHIAQEYGPDAVIVPSLWGQDIFDAFCLKEQYPDFALFMQRDIELTKFCERYPVAEQFNDKESNSLSTAGFPNMITALIPGKAAAQTLGQKLSEKLTEEWKTIGNKIRDDIRKNAIAFLTEDVHQSARTEFWREFDKTLPSQADPTLYRREASLLKQENCWEWRHIWDAQLDNTWEPYWAAVPLGNPEQTLVEANVDNYAAWAEAQDEIAWPPTPLPSEAEKRVYIKELNVGTWWGSLQQRLRTAHMAVKNTRHWQIPAAPGPRSSLSGQFSAVHPRLNYQKLKRNGDYKDFREGGGLPESSMRLFWLLMSYAYKGLFNGSEMLNALELTKRMAWQFGGVAESMGIPTTLTSLKPEDYEKDDRDELHLQENNQEIDYEQLVRFPNLSSIAAARFMYESYEQPNSKLRAYWRVLRQKIGQEFETFQHRDQFAARTRGRPTQVIKTDRRINSDNRPGHNYNGVMFSSKWLADDMNLDKTSASDGINEVAILRRVVDEAHRHKDVNFGDGSPGDWWVIVLGDGDGMGSYISGEKLEKYKEYLVDLEASHYLDQAANANLEEFSKHFQKLLETSKRMGPATHIGLNRALLDFSNRLVPYLTEKRYCGRVIYSGGDDVMAVLPLEDLPEYLRSLRAAWSGEQDPDGEFDSNGGYWHPKSSLKGISQRPHFTMGKDATMSLGIVIAYKTVPLPTVLESLWDAEQTAKAMPGKDGLCFRVIYGGGNTLEALMKGKLLDDWWKLVNHGGEELSPLLYRLAEELPKRACITPNCYLFAEAAKVIAKNRDESRHTLDFDQFCNDLNQWLRDWEDWARTATETASSDDPPSGTRPEDLGYLLRFSAFWISKNAQRRAWVQPEEAKV
ncbi:MAG: type III-B CRISPR-associated protein Cas10/Cmr2 [Thainema sp.]